MNQINISAKIVAGTNRNKRTKATSTTNLAVDGAPAAPTGQPIDASKFVAKDSSVLQTIASPIAVNGAFSATSISENGVLLSTKYITPAGVDAKINAIINAAPTTLDTLSELATALGNDPNFATTITNLIGTKAPLESPNFTGLPKVAGNVIFHAGNANLQTIDWNARTLNVKQSADATKVINITPNGGGSAWYVKLDTVTAGNNLLIGSDKYIRINKTTGRIYTVDGVNEVWDAGNSNLNTVAWTCAALTASSAVINGTITGVSGIISFNGLTDASTVITGSLPVGMRFDRGNTGFLNTPFNVNNANGLLTLTSHPTSGTGTHGKQLFFTDNEELYVRKFSNGTASPWRNIWHSGNSNLPTVDWAARNLTASTAICNSISANTTPVANSSKLDGFGLISNRATMYITNAGGNIVLGVGSTHSANNIFTVNGSGVIVSGNSTVSGVVKSSDFNGSGFTAVGWQIGDYSNLNNLDVRSRLQVYEFVQNKINISNGNLIVTDSAKIESIQDLRPTYNTIRFTFTEQHPFNVGDILRCKTPTKDYLVTVSAVSADKLFFDSYSNLDVVKTNAAVNDLLVRWNSNTDAARKGLLYLNSSDTNAPNFQVLYNGQIKGCFGNCAGLNWQGAALPANTWAVWVKGGYFDEVNVRGSITVTGGNAETVTGAQTKADAALSAANYQLTLLNNSLGSLAYKSAVSTAMLDSTVIVGGYIKTSLLDVTSIIVSGGIAKTTDLSTAIGNKFTYIDSSGVYTGTLSANQVKATNAVFGTANISDAAITQVKIVDGAITTAKITDAAITGAKIASASITNAKIADLAVTGAKIASATITDANILSLNADKIVAGKIKAQYIESDKITALGAITAASFNLGNGAFSVSSEGILTAIGATIKGSITADSGKISGFALANNTITATGASNEVLLNSNEGFLKITGVSQAVGNYYSQLGVKALEGENQSLLGAYTAGYFSIGSAPAANKNIALYAKGTFINGYNAAIYATGRIITDQSVYDWGYNDEIAVLPATITLHVTENLKYLIGHGFSGQTLIYQLPRLSEIQNSLFATNDENFMITLKIIVKHDSGNVAINPSLDYPLYNNNGNNISGQSLSRGDSVDVTIIKQDGSVWAQFNNYAF